MLLKLMIRPRSALPFPFLPLPPSSFSFRQRAPLPGLVSVQHVRHHRQSRDLHGIGRIRQSHFLQSRERIFHQPSSVFCVRCTVSKMTNHWTRRALDHSLILSFVRLQRSLIRLLCPAHFARALCSRVYGKEVFVYDMNAFISYGFNSMCARSSSSARGRSKSEERRHSRSSPGKDAVDGLPTTAHVAASTPTRHTTTTTTTTTPTAPSAESFRLELTAEFHRLNVLLMRIDKSAASRSTGKGR